MARGDEKGLDKGRVKVRVIEFEMDGSNQTLRESIRDIVGAIGRGAASKQQIAITRDGSAAGQPALGQESPDAIIDIEPEPVNASDGEFGEAPASGGIKKTRSLRTPQVLDGLDLNQGSVPLVGFLEKLNPSSETNRYAAVSYWLKEVAKVDEVSADHIHTAYKRMKWPTPADASATFRQLKGTKYGYMSKGGKAGFYKLNHVGDGHIEKLMKAVGLEL